MKKVEKSVDWLKGKLAVLIDEQARKGYGITRRTLRQRVPSCFGVIVEAILEGWVSEGVIVITGTGKRESPIIVSRPVGYKFDES